MLDGTRPKPGGRNRFSLEVFDLAGTVEQLRDAGVHFRNDIITGVGGKQILLDDPSGNPIELLSQRRVRPHCSRARKGSRGIAARVMKPS